jgi:hypothetical protein
VCSIALCSLRAAITSATASAGPHSIIFNLAYPITITLSSTLPTINNALTIAGLGSANLSISGAGLYRVFKAGSGSNLHLSGLAIRNGYDDIQGGGILVNHGALTLEDVIVANSLAGGGNGGGLNNISGIVDICYTTFDSNDAFHDGGITNNGTITIDNSLFINNTARTGGAIDNSGTLIVTNSAFSGNVAGIISGGAIQNSGTLVIANSTFNQNGSSNGADIANGGTLNVTNSTFYGAILPSGSSIANGGAGAVATLRNTILAASPGVSNCSNLPGGVLTANSYNLATDATCASATLKTLPQLNLGPMENNGGNTPTIGLLPGSAAIDSASDAVCAASVGAPVYGAGGLDQRAVSRPQGVHCDVGSFEADNQVGTDLIVNNAADPGALLCTLASCSLRAAVLTANSEGIAGVHTIGFDLSYPVVITLTSPLPAITGTLTIAGPGSANLGISGDDLYRVLEIGNGASLSVNNLAIRHGYDTNQGGGLYNDHGVLSLTNLVVTDNTAGGGNGGGLNNAGGIVTIASTTFADNLGFHDGAISNSGSMTILNSTFTDNHARTGGAINNSGTLTVTSTTFSGNVADPVSGGAIQNSGVLVVANSSFYNNGSPVGGDIANENGVLGITNSTFYSDTLPTASSIENRAGAQTTLRNTILAAGPGIDNCASSGGSTLTADAYNLATDSTCASATLTTTVQLMLGGQGLNGGPTPTIPLLPGSAAIDCGNDSLCAAAVGAPDYGAGGVDQRGVSRPQGSHCDVGAFEYFPMLVIYLPLVQ